MSRIDINDDCDSAAEAFARARAGFDRRMRSYQMVQPRSVETPANESAPPRKMIWAIAQEVARQLGIKHAILKCEPENGKSLPIAQYRQLAMALALRLTGKSPARIGKSFGADRTTILCAKERMAPILAATGMTDKDSLPRWIAAALPLLFVYIGQLRARSRGRSGQILNGGNSQ